MDATLHFDVYQAHLTDTELTFTFSRCVDTPSLKHEWMGVGESYFNGYTYTTAAHGWGECREHHPGGGPITFSPVEGLVIDDRLAVEGSDTP